MNKKCFVVTNPDRGWRDYIVCVYLAVNEEAVYQYLHEEGYGNLDTVKEIYILYEKNFEEIRSQAEIRDQKIDKILK